MADTTKIERPEPKKPLFGGGVLPPLEPPKGGTFGLPPISRAKLVGLGLVATALYLAANSYFIVHPAERAMVRFLGKVTSDKPLQPGLHLRSPFFTQG